MALALCFVRDVYKRQGYTDLLVRLTEDERQRFYLDNMKSSSQHLLKLVSDLLDFHRLDLNKAEVNRVTFNPSQLFEEIRISFEPLTACLLYTSYLSVLVLRGYVLFLFLHSLKKY